jgi:hypothetical protein
MVENCRRQGVGPSVFLVPAPNGAMSLSLCWYIGHDIGHSRSRQASAWGDCSQGTKAGYKETGMNSPSPF